ncbi:hypothetical protein O6P43_023649 [Quillaja saponaria]|uniref:Uncharacterized protein n=1 Tax=Quillaja saponaria TaxID=32244 RepID=A0AAD7PJN0_QUISA|nr:hypothetical protein O6P43_023649 [Quillaja saponaria]
MENGHSKLDSLLNGDAVFVNKILSRKSSVGHQSSRSFYSWGNDGVPFNWELLPGQPIVPPNNEIILPPLSPPPPVSQKSQLQILPRPKPPAVSSVGFMYWLRKIFKRNKINTNKFQRESPSYKSSSSSNSDGDLSLSTYGSSYKSTSSSSSSIASSSNFSADARSPKRYNYCRLFFT